jgi:Domain of unknown function (DUF4389)
MTNQAWSPAYPAPSAEPMAELDIPGPTPQRRLTIFFRWLLLLPQFIVLAVLYLAAFFVTIAGWCAALVLGRLPDSIASFLTGYLNYETRVRASAMLLVDTYPPFGFDAPEHPVQVEVHPGELNRLAVFFRIILLIPAAIVSALVLSGWYTVSFIIWIIALILGRMPNLLFESSAAVLRYSMRLSAYVLMLTSAYPKRLFGDEDIPGRQTSTGTRPLGLSTGARVLVVVFMLLGIGSNVFSDSSWPHHSSNMNNNF